MMVEDKYLIVYFGRQADYYLDKYKAFCSGNKLTFNTGSFLAGIFWFFYRKLFIQAVAIILLLVMSGIVEGYIYDILSISHEAQSVIFIVSSIGFAILYGFTGNYIYLNDADKKIQAILRHTSVEEERITMLERKGGVSALPFILLGLFIIICVVFSLIDIPA